MPKYEIYLNPGDEIPEDLTQVLTKKFNEKSLDKLKRFGGRVQLSVTAPFTDRKKQKKNVIIDKAFVEQLAVSATKSQEILAKMTLKQLKEVAKIVQFPLSSKTTVEEVRKQLISVLFSNETWKKIAK